METNTTTDAAGVQAILHARDQVRRMTRSTLGRHILSELTEFEDVSRAWAVLEPMLADDDVRVAVDHTCREPVGASLQDRVVAYLESWHAEGERIEKITAQEAREKAICKESAFIKDALDRLDVAEEQGRALKIAAWLLALKPAARRGDVTVAEVLHSFDGEGWHPDFLGVSLARIFDREDDIALTNTLEHVRQASRIGRIARDRVFDESIIDELG